MFRLTTSFRLAIAITPILRTIYAVFVFVCCPHGQVSTFYVLFTLRFIRSTFTSPVSTSIQVSINMKQQKTQVPESFVRETSLKSKKGRKLNRLGGKKTVINLISSSNIYQRETSRRSHNSRQRKSAQTANGCLPSA